ncbi:MFS transporter [Sinomonas halotolerans]|uniref:MFS transporter n=1 Tax=Sinomonas halotolerans TaxID=1644133 RepID=A0ABU9WW11_9MICC
MEATPSTRKTAVEPSPIAPTPHASHELPPAAGQLTAKDVRIATWICFFAWTFAVYDFVLFGNLLPVLAAELGWAPAQSTEVNTWVTAGTALVAFAVGPLVDRIGRRKGILISVIGAAVASLLTAVAGWAIGVVGGLGIVLLILVRSAAGLGYAEQSVNAAYLNELFAHAYSDPAKARRRGLIYSLVQSGWPIGSVLAAASIYLLFPVGGWALCFIVAAFPAIFIVIAGRWLKESPQFEAHRHESHGASPLVEAFRGESLRSTVVIGLSFMLNWVGVLVFAILGTSLLSAPDGKDIPFTNALVILVVSNATAFAGYVFHGWLGDRIGRRNTIALGWILCGASFTAMLLAPSGNFGVVVALYSAGLFFLIGPFSALLFFNGESFPVRTRATGGSIINAGGQVGAIISSFLITLALGAGWTWSTAAFWIGCVPIFASGLLILGARNVHPHHVRQD